MESKEKDGSDYLYHVLVKFPSPMFCKFPINELVSCITVQLTFLHVVLIHFLFHEYC